MSDPTKTLCAKYKVPTPQGLDQKDLIMVVDDQTDLRLIVGHQIQKLACGTSKMAANGYDAVELLRSDRPKVSAYICDLDMPVMNGLDFLAELQENPDLDRAPFCLMMDGVSKEKIMLAVEQGVDEVLVKPFTLADIGPKLRSTFAKFHNPNNPERVYELAKQALRGKKLDAAFGIYTDLAAATGKAARPWVGMARVEMERGDAKAALRHLGEAEKRNPNYVHVFAERARILARSGDWEGAIAAFRQAIDMSPLNALRYQAAAEILFTVKRYQEASELLEIALKYNLAFPDLFHYLSQAKFALKDYKLAQKYIRQALNSDSENTAYLNQLGICLKETGQMDEAVKVYNQVIKNDPANEPALYNKAVLMHAKGDTPEAVKLLERLLRKNPGFEPAKAKLAEYKGAGDPKVEGYGASVAGGSGGAGSEGAA